MVGSIYKNRILNIQMLFVSLFPVLGIYLTNYGLSVGVFVLLILLLFDFRALRFNKNVLFFFISILFVSLVSFSLSYYQLSTLFVNNSLQVMSFAVLLSYYITNPNKEAFRKYYVFVAIISTFVLFYQTFSFYILNKPITFYLPINEDMIERISFSSAYWGRPASFFLEPAHYSIYVLPALYYAIVNNKKFIAIIITLGLLLSTSTSGFAIALFLYLRYYLLNARNFKYLLLLIFFGILIYFTLYEIIDSIVDRNIAKLDSDNMGENIRLFGTFNLLYELNAFQIIIGVGHNQLVELMAMKNIYTFNYASSFLMIIFSFGLISYIPFIILLYYLYKKNINKGYFYIFILVLFSDQILFNQNFFHLTMCIVFLQDFSSKNINTNLTQYKNENNILSRS